MTAIECPACDSQTLVATKRQASGVTIDDCPSCGGCWCDASELGSLDGSVWKNTEELAYEQVPTHPKRDCPRCALAMTPLSPSEDRRLVVDRCNACGGFWLDGGELDRIKQIALDSDDAKLDDVEIARVPNMSMLRWLVRKIGIFKE